MGVSTKLRNPSDRSNDSTNGIGISTSDADVEYFWACELTADKRTVTWAAPNDSLEEDDEDYINHSLYIRQVCLGAGAVDKEENIVAMESAGFNGEVFKGTVANLSKGVNTMVNLSFTIHGKNGVTFTLAEGSGPISICGNQLLDYPRDYDVDMSQTEESRVDTEEEEEVDEECEDEEEEDEEEEMEEEEEKGKANKPKGAKRKAPIVKANKGKQKPKMSTEEEEDDEDEEDESSEEEEESDSKPKKTKKEVIKKEMKVKAKVVKANGNKAKKLKK